MSNELKDLIDEIQYRSKLTQKQIAEKVGYTREYLSQAVRNNTKGKIITMLRKEFKDVINVKPTQQPKAIPETKEGTPLEKLINHNSDLIVAHKDVAIANKATAEANRLSASTTNELAIANRELAEANRELTIMLKNSINSNGQNNQQNVADLYLNRIAEKGVPMWWPTKEAGLQILGKLLDEDEPTQAVLNNQAKADKSSIS